METFELHVVTPDGEIFGGDIKRITLRTAEGDVGIMKGHINYLAAVDIGVVRICMPDDTEKRASCGGGFITVENGNVKLVATTFEFAENIDLSRAEAAKKRAEAIIESNADKKAIALAKLKLARASNRISAKGE